MATSSDGRSSLNQRRGLWPLLVQTVADWKEDKAPRLAAALAFYTALSIAPLLVIVIAITGFALGEEAARGQILGVARRDVEADDGLSVVQGSTQRRGAVRAIDDPEVSRRGEGVDELPGLDRPVEVDQGGGHVPDVGVHRVPEEDELDDG